ncbi:hypothetical protein H5410_041724 [Solanum commersonii]|uniref:Uncharacterized protein n=1 Tax=Solanum commersonii TaxID=4109 RepID=A0A9J5XTX5_SOLCO|nr:hypothetical protein H5410_041724 [Solanum commersonii]
MASSQTSLFDLGQATEKGNTTLLYLPLMWKYAETKSHLILHCRVTTRLWDIVLAIVGLSWSVPTTTLDMLPSWNRRGGTKGYIGDTEALMQVLESL